jgi:hypothetical protein
MVLIIHNLSQEIEAEERLLESFSEPTIILIQTEDRH